MATAPRVIVVDSVDSTNSYIKQLTDAAHATVVACREQTAGRGQRGNHWEAEPGKNLTFSLLIRPTGISAANQFSISRAVALGIVDVVKRHLGPDSDVAVKWPNDIYVGDRKICGILIENSLTGSVIVRSIIGVGLNVNQTEFRSDAPNPISLKQLTGDDYDLDALLGETVDAIVSRVEEENASRGEASAEEYFNNLWRRDGFHPYSTPAGERFDAAIESIDSMGFLTLRHRDSTLTRHAFKEVHHILR